MGFPPSVSHIKSAHKNHAERQGEGIELQAARETKMDKEK
jgi:hypothetical protein